MPLQLAPQVCFALRASGIACRWHHELHEFFMALFVQFGLFVHTHFSEALARGLNSFSFFTDTPILTPLPAKRFAPLQVLQEA